MPAGLSTTSRCSSSQTDVEVHLLGCERAGLGRKLDDDLLPALEPVALRPGLTVDEDGAVRDQALGERA